MLRPSQINMENSKRWLLCVLLPALLFTQWLGLAHRISHAGGTANQISSNVVQQTAQWGSFLFGNQDEGSNTLHSCALYDAVSAAEFLQHVPDAIELLAGQAVISLSQAILSWHALLQVPFSSRAPPSLFA
ncbi:MAG: hypothetical protein HY254_00165 [Burkholderiales bacterium]|nr:hypothetical protein [Burkholderiales bacterium]